MLRGGAEHRNLKISQFQRNFSPQGAVRYTYTENASKNRSGGFNQLNVENKVVHQYQDLTLGERCHVALLDAYFSKLPEGDIFYVRPVSDAQFAANPEKWFTSLPIGKNSLSTMLKKMCAEAGVAGKKTNNSLRAYAATELFNTGIPEKVIQERSGHRSLEGLRKYERVSEQQRQDAYKTLAPYSRPCVPSETNSENLPVSSLAPSSSVGFHRPFQSLQLTNMPMYQSEQQSPSCFGGARMAGCTINIYQAPSVKTQASAPYSATDVAELFSDGW